MDRERGEGHCWLHPPRRLTSGAAHLLTRAQGWAGTWREVMPRDLAGDIEEVVEAALWVDRYVRGRATWEGRTPNSAAG